MINWKECHLQQCSSIKHHRTWPLCWYSCNPHGLFIIKAVPGSQYIYLKIAYGHCVGRERVIPLTAYLSYYLWQCYCCIIMVDLLSDSMHWICDLDNYEWKRPKCDVHAITYQAQPARKSPGVSVPVWLLSLTDWPVHWCVRCDILSRVNLFFNSAHVNIMWSKLEIPVPQRSCWYVTKLSIFKLCGFAAHRKWEISYTIIGSTEQHSM